MSLTTPQYIKTFLKRLLEILTNIIFVLYSERCQHLEICTTQRSNIFQMTNIFCFQNKFYMDEIFIQNPK